MGAPPAVRLVVFAKLPIQGRVKTRLAESIGAEKTLRLYREWVPPAIEKLLSLGPSVSIEITLDPPAVEGVSDAEALDQARSWIPLPVDWSLQSGPGLGERLTEAFDRQYASGWTRVFALGTDSPHLTTEDLTANFRLLDRNDLVLGPTEDGGYYAVGLKSPPDGVFAGVRWSSESTLADTEANARRKGWSVGLGPMSFDIDTFEDLDRLMREGAAAEWGTLRRILSED